MTPPEKESRDFEAWLKRQDFDGPIPDTMSDFLDCLNECWQAALKSVVVEKSAPTSEGFEDAYNKFRSEHVNASFMPKDMARAMFIAGQASRNIRLPSEEQVELAAKKDIGLHRQDNRLKTCTNNDFYIAVTSAFIRGTKYVIAMNKDTLK